MERTLILIKPDAFARGLTGEIIGRFERKGLRLAAINQLTMTRELAEQHYAEHAGKPFFDDLVEFMTSGPVVVQVLEGDNAVALYRDVMGATNPANAAPGTIRQLFAESFTGNSVHGSDSPENAQVEIAQFFEAADIVG